MYSQNKSLSQNKSFRKPYCKVCHDAGKSEEIYTSHYVRSDPGPNGKVVCPTLLANQCKYCCKQGHTASHCKEINKNNKEAAKMEAKKNYRSNQENKEETKKTIKKNNLFDILEEEEITKENYKENYKKEKKIVKEDFPALTSKKTVTATAIARPTEKSTLPALSYVTIAQKGYQEAVKEEILFEKKKMAEVQEKPIIIVQPKKIVEKKKRSWAEMASDDEDDEEEEEEENLPTFHEYMELYIGNDAW